VWNGTWKRGFIDAVLKVKVYGMFYPVQKRSHSIKEYKSWFEGMNLIYKRPSFNRAISRKLGCKVYKEGVGLFVWAKLPAGSTSAEEFINDILYNNLFYHPGTILV
jgi:DNA-binding transcriptional MocR family regulator